MRLALGLLVMSACGRWGFDAGGTAQTDAATDGVLPGDADEAGRELTLLAGNLDPAGHQDGIGAQAVMARPSGLASDGTYLYIADSWTATIRRMTLASGEVTTFAGAAWEKTTVDGSGTTARFHSPRGLVLVGTDLFVADRGAHVIRRIDTTTGMVTTFAGQAGSRATVEGTGTAARFDTPTAIATDGTSLYVVQALSIRKIDIASANVTSLAGSGQGNADGPGATAMFNYPQGISYEGGSLFVADNYNNAIRVVDPVTGDVSTAVTLIDGRFTAIAVSATAAYVSNGHRLLRFDRPAFTQTVIGGLRWNEGSADGASATSRFKGPDALALDGAMLHVADTGNANLRRLDTTTSTTQVAAGRLGLTTGNADGVGGSARFDEVNDIVTDGTTVWVADEGGHVLRQIDVATGSAQTVAGVFGSYGLVDGVGSEARLHRPSGLALHGESVYFVDEDSHTLRSFHPGTREVVTHAGGVQGALDGIGAAAQFDYPTHVASDGTYLYVADTGAHTIRRVDPATWNVETIAGTADATGIVDGIGAAARFRSPRGLAYCGEALWIADLGNTAIRRIDPVTREVTTIAGAYNDRRHQDGVGTAARFMEPRGVACNGTRLLIADSEATTVRALDLATHEVTTYIGKYPVAYDVDGPLDTATTNSPLAVATANDLVLIANTYNVRVLR